MAKKMKTLMVLLVTVVGFSLLGFLPATAAIVEDYDGAWYATSGDSNFIDFEGKTLLDFSLLNEGGDPLVVLSGGGRLRANTVWFTQEGSEWFAGLNEGQKDLNLGSTGYFWYQYGNLTTYDYSQGGPNIYYLYFGGDQIALDGPDMIAAVDVAPVPIPGAALLLGSGLLGLGWVRKRRSA